MTKVNFYDLFEGIITKVKEIAKEMGGKEFDSDNNNVRQNYKFRKNLHEDGSPYFGFIEIDESDSGPYSDLSLVITPNLNDPSKPWVISLGVGTNGFKDDYALAQKPGVRRLFSSIIKGNSERTFLKSDFTDEETEISESFLNIADLNALSSNYKKVMLCCELIESPLKLEPQEEEENNSAGINEDAKYDAEANYMLSDNAINIIKKFIAAYAKMRGWNKGLRGATDKVNNILVKYSFRENKDENNLNTEIKDLLKQRKYIVLEGPPGTGKTRAATKVAENMNADVIFTQFHAETTYSDFIYGLRPKLDESNLTYEKKEGVFLEAIKTAKIDQDKVVVLIIDEINRANLSNVLGEIFYLFETNRDNSNKKIKIGAEDYYKLPENLHVIATMNTADRSLAVVDFALRRRFAWYEMYPMDISSSVNENKSFHKEQFQEIASIFEWHATSEELNLQPGHSYFITSGKQTIENRIEYELLPLIREYIKEGYLLSAKDDLNTFFRNSIQKEIFN